MDLGYTHCYHYGALMLENPRDAEMWNEAWDAKFEGKGNFGRKDWDQLLGHCQAVTDVPCCVFWKELLEAYPDAKVILTRRDTTEQWHDSIMKTVVPIYNKLNYPTKTWGAWFYRMFLPYTELTRLDRRMVLDYDMYRLLEQDQMNGTQKAVQWFEDYYAEVERTVPEERLLVFNAKEGWEPLCKFLEDEVPAYEFPKMNTRQDWDRVVTPMEQAIDRDVHTKMIRTVGSVLAGVVGVGAFYLWRRRSSL